MNPQNLAQNLAQIDANLLVALDRLLSERSVTAAAKRMGVTQSAMSQTLARLRALFDDPLLVRVGATMEPTPYALELAGALTDALEQLEGLLRRRPSFEPSTVAREFTIATSDSGASSFVPQLAARLQVAAPAIELRIVSIGAEVEAPLRRGEFDLAIGVFTASEALRVAPLYPERFRVLVRERHPLLRAGDPLDCYCAQRHVLVGRTGRGQGAVDLALVGLGRSRTIAVRVPFFSIAPQIVAASELVLTAPARALQQFTATLPVKTLAPPFAVADFEVAMAWHVRFDRDPANRWLRERVHECARAGQSERRVSSPRGRQP